MKLEKFNYNEGKGKRMFLYGFIMCAVLMVLINLFFSEAKYLNTESVKIVEGTIKNYSPYDFKLLAVKLENENGEYENSDTIPESGYILNETESYCTIPNEGGNDTKDQSIVINYHDGVVGFDNINTRNTKCYLYFYTLKTFTIQDIIANKTISTRTDFSTTLTADTTGTIYTAEDDYGTSYYYAGATTDNWVKFGGFYWRIIRINGDGTLRLIYSGSEESGPATTGEATQIGTSAFNSNTTNNMYVGYMYTSGQVHGTGTASTIKGVLDTWYTNNLSGYSSDIAIGGGATFCNDRQPSTSETSLNGSGGTGTTITWYAGYIRLVNGKSPSFKCADSGDRFSESIGLITADELAYAGGVYKTNNTSYYLYTDNAYWTATPFMYSNLYYSVVFAAYLNGWIRDLNVENNAWSVRPVINLKSDTRFIEGGTGTAENPYVVQ